VAVPGYAIERELGRGGMGVVYQARHLALGRTVALKMILAGRHAGSDDLVRFRTEAQAIARLQHPNIVAVYEVGEHDGKPFLSLEFCPGGSLERKLAGSPLPPSEAAKLTLTLARAMHAAHQARVIHRDLKPGNVLLAADGTPKITDFGLAKKLDDQGQTQTGAVMGTPSYMAPEQAAGSKDLGPAVDVYALGAVLYELLTGRPPFKAATLLETLGQVVNEDPVPPRQLNATVPADLETVCLKCLRKEPRVRYPTAGALAEDLHRWQAGEPVVARPAGLGERLVKWSRRRPTLAALVAVSVAALLTLVGGGLVFSLSLAAQARRAERAEKQATDRARDAEREQGRAERMLYAGQIASAQREWELGNLNIAWDHLQRCQADLRGWEHGHLRGLFQRNQRTLLGHTAGVTAVAWSPDGGQVLSDDGKTLKVWDVAKGRAVFSVAGQEGRIARVAWTPGGPRVLSSDGKTLKIWDVVKGRAVFSVAETPDGLGSDVPPATRWSPDGRRLLTGSNSGTVLKVWDVEKGQEVVSFKGHAAPVLSVAWSPDGKHILSGDVDNTLKLWDAEKGRESLRLQEHKGGIQYRLAWSPDGKRFLSACAVGRDPVKVWDAKLGREVRSLGKHTAQVDTLGWSPDSRRILTGDSSSQAVQVWDAESGQEVLSLKGEAGGMSRFGGAWSPDSKRLLTPSGYCTIKVWDAESGREVRSLKGHKHPVLSVAWSPDGTRIASGSMDSTVKLWDPEKGQEPLALNTHAASVAWGPGSKLIASGNWDNTVKVWDARKGKELLSLKGHTGAVWTVAFSPGGKRIVSGSDDRTLKVWDAEKGREVLSLTGHTGPVRGLAWSPDGKRIVSGSDDRTLKVWDAEKGRELFSLKGHTDAVRSVAWSRDGKRLASGGRDGTLKVWDAVAGQELLSFRCHTWVPSGVAWSPDSTRVLTESNRNWLKVWDAANGQELLSLEGGPGGVSCVAWSPDGKRILCGSRANTLRLWDARSGQEVCTLKGHTGAVTCVAWGPDGKRIVSGSNDRTLKVWDAEEGK
jgi:WD40 repeat protein